MVEMIKNGGFETGDLTYWTCIICPTVESSVKHSGNYACHFAPTTDDQGMRQNFPFLVPFNKIISFGFWYLNLSSTGNGTQVTVEFNYGEYGNYIQLELPPNSEWSYFDLITPLNNWFTAHGIDPNIVTIEYIDFLSYYPLWTPFYIDDVSCIATGITRSLTVNSVLFEGTGVASSQGIPFTINMPPHVVTWQEMMPPTSGEDNWTINMTQPYTVILDDLMTVSSPPQYLEINASDSNQIAIWHIEYIDNTSVIYAYFDSQGNTLGGGNISCNNGHIVITVTGTSITFEGLTSVTVNVPFRNLVLIRTYNGDGDFNGGELDISILPNIIGTTPFTVNLEYGGTYIITVPTTFDDGFVFVIWEDNSLNPIRTIVLTSDTTITAYYILMKDRLFWDDVNYLYLYDIITWEEEQDWNPAIRNVPLKTSGSVVEKENYIILPKKIRITTRLSDNEKATLESIIALQLSQNCYVTLSAMHDWTYRLWIQNTTPKYKYIKDSNTVRPWETTLNTVVIVGGRGKELIINGGFEFGNMLGWTGTGNVWSFLPHWGLCDWSGLNGSYIQQILSNPINVDNILIFELYYMALPYYGTMTVTVTYSDTSTTVISQYVYGLGYTKLDILSYLTAGKTVTAIRIDWAGFEDTSLYIDDVSLIGEP